MIFWIWLGVAVGVVVLYLRQVYSKFRNSQVNHLPYIPLFGNMWRATLRLQHFTDLVKCIYDKFPEDRFVGHYEFMNPLVVIRDLELLKQVGVKESDIFVDHRVFINEDNDPLFGSNLFSLKGQKWRDMRATLSPAFTSSKIRLMVPFMLDVGNQMIDTLKNKMKDQGSDSLEIEVKDLSTRYANDVIATCAFGVKVNSMDDENNEFYEMGKRTANFDYVQILKFLGFTSMPTIMNMLKLKIFPDNVGDFFRNLVLGTMKNREQNNIHRPDMIHLLMEAKKGNLTHENKADEDAGFATVEESSLGKNSINRVWSDDDLVAQGLLFFLAGFDTVATMMAFLIYELGINPECQQKLYDEIKATDFKKGGFDYNSVQNMKYLDMVVSEVLRKWPPVVATDRIANKQYNLGKPNSKADKDYILKKGEGVWLPVWAIHRDPQYYEDPEKFDPERFSEENKHKIQPYTYFPFGTGPRNCIGSRFALCEVKVMLYQLIQHMEVSPCKRTCIPAELTLDTFNLRLKGGHWLKVTARK